MTTTALPQRPGPRPRTHRAPPHTQLDAEPVPELIDRPAARCFALPYVTEEPTSISVPGARALVATPSAPFAATKAMVGREFAHIHPDGSMHLILPPDVATAAIDAEWAEPHPMAAYLEPSLVMLYTPRNNNELETIGKLVEASHANLMTSRPVPSHG